MGKMTAIAALLLLSLLLTACGDPVPTTMPSVPTEPSVATQYTIRVVDSDGNPVANALVGMCQDKEGGICYMPALTDTDGIVIFPETVVPVQDYIKVRVLSAVGFELPRDERGEILYTPIPNGVTQFTLTLARE